MQKREALEQEQTLGQEVLKKEAFWQEGEIWPAQKAA